MFVLFLPVLLAAQPSADEVCGKVGPTTTELTDLENAEKDCKEAMYAAAEPVCNEKRGAASRPQAFTDTCAAIRHAENYFCSEKKVVMSFVKLRRGVMEGCKSSFEKCEGKLKCIGGQVTELFKHGLANMDKEVRVFRDRKLETQVMLEDGKDDYSKSLKELKDLVAQPGPDQEAGTKLLEIATPVIEDILSKIKEVPAEAEVTLDTAKVENLDHLEDMLHDAMTKLEMANVAKARTNVALYKQKAAEQHDDAEGGLTITKERARKFSDNLRGPKYLSTK